MISEQEQEFLNKALAAAKAAGHPFPQMAACEAALESSWGDSQLAALDNNLFGMKQHQHPVYGTVSMRTNEFLGFVGWKAITAEFVKYPDWASCFADRVATLKRLAPYYIHYRNALLTTDVFVYITEVSKTWSTDPGRAAKCIEIWQQGVWQ